MSFCGRHVHLPDGLEERAGLMARLLEELDAWQGAHPGGRDERRQQRHAGHRAASRC